MQNPSDDEEAGESRPARRMTAADYSQELQDRPWKQSKPTGEQLPSEHSESSPGTTRAMVDPIKGRFCNAYSSILLPRRIGRSINLPTELKFHSYGWNVNTRVEPTMSSTPTVCHYLSLQDMSQYSLVFFEVVDPIYHFIDRSRYFDRCSTYWASQTSNLEDFEAMVSGVVALGSFFSETPSPIESKLVEHAKRVLDVGYACTPGRLSLDQTGAWVCRTLYLRLTTRPHLAWYASCSTMHVAEAMGLHVDLRDVDMTAAQDASKMTLELMASRRNLLQCATFLNALISADYGRSRVILQDATDPDPQSSSKLVKLTLILNRLQNGIQASERLEILSYIKGLPEEPPIFVLLKTDVAIHLYRKNVDIENERLPPQESKVMLSIIKTALTEARCLLPHRHPWWNILFTPFQCLLVLLAMDSDESLSLVSESMSVLSAVNQAFLTHLTGEVMNTAATLVQGLEKRKTKQARFLSKAYTSETAKEPAAMMPRGSEPMQIMGQSETFFDNWVAGDMDWSQFLGGGPSEQMMSFDSFNFP